MIDSHFPNHYKRIRYVISVAETYRSVVPPKVYEAIKNYVFSIDD